jgi:CTP:molybdopterin cytidylyltransferase MocA
MLGVRARAVRDCSPALCFDIDTWDDYRYALDRSANV